MEIITDPQKQYMDEIKYALRREQQSLHQPFTVSTT